MCCAELRAERFILKLTSLSESTAATPAAGLAAAAVLDAQALARLQELDPSGTSGLVARVLTTYSQSLQRQLGVLQKARQDHDLSGQRHVAHTLKSSSASVGALKLSALCAEVERRLRDGLPESLETQLDELAAEGQRVLAALRPA
jgi:HPt (histidine-containing phosphotransfer) domain-containing protein